MIKSLFNRRENMDKALLIKKKKRALLFLNIFGVSFVAMSAYQLSTQTLFNPSHFVSVSYSWLTIIYFANLFYFMKLTSNIQTLTEKENLEISQLRHNNSASGLYFSSEEELSQRLNQAFEKEKNR